MTSSGKNGLNIRTNASPKWTGPGARRSKRPLLASHTRCNVLWIPAKFGNKVKIGIKVQFGNKSKKSCKDMCLILLTQRSLNHQKNV